MMPIADANDDKGLTEPMRTRYRHHGDSVRHLSPVPILTTAITPTVWHLGRFALERSRFWSRSSETQEFQTHKY